MLRPIHPPIQDNRWYVVYRREFPSDGFIQLVTGQYYVDNIKGDRRYSIYKTFHNVCYEEELKKLYEV